MTHQGSNSAGRSNQLTQADVTDAATGATLPQLLFDDANVANGVTEEPWFLTPESWIADYHAPPEQPDMVQEEVLHRFVDKVRGWLRRWGSEGSSPLHHRYLYRERMPRPVQDAYSAVSMYHASVSSGSVDVRITAAQVLEDRVSQLLEDQALESSLLAAGGKEMHIFDQLSRVQALLTYQTIRLFDGDVRMRAQAEELIPTLFQWTRELLDCAKENLTRPSQFLADIAACTSSLQVTFTRSGVNEASEYTSWRAWILVESVRRTWVVANHLQEIYLYWKRSWSECPGRVAITMQGGLWDAASPYAWSRACRDNGTLFLSTKRTECLFYERCPEDVDEFSWIILELSYGVDRMERWLGESKDRETAILLRGLDGISVMA
ncbi:hypothetical protein M426DRAFT_318833 [Hypoxylon sp. CI-4A]|nr:hypothetical protein M426DRAFT_318833 [Hypoxylon sp. CI-4A]